LASRLRRRASESIEGPPRRPRSTAAGKTIRRTSAGAWSGPERADIFVTELADGLLMKPVEPEIFVDFGRLYASRHPAAAPRNPIRADRKESTKFSLKYRRGKGEILIVSHAGRGWWDPMSDAKGDVFKLV
jgi:hypothetical protein